jgi:heterodisulfide reductase subunit A
MKVYHEEDGRKLREFAKELITRVRNNKNITVHLDTQVKDVGGFVGNFKVQTTNGEIETGSIVVAVGAEEYKPKEHLYGRPPVVTQLELEDLMQKGPLAAKTIAMIQCVGSRNTEAPLLQQGLLRQCHQERHQHSEGQPERRGVCVP